MRTSRVLALACAALLGAASLPAQDNRGYVAAVSDGAGVVKLFWPMPRASWPPSGYTLERLDLRGAATPVGRGLRPEWDEVQARALKPEQADALSKLAAADREAAAGRPPKDYDGLKGFVFINAAADFAFARACGLAFEDRPSGPSVYRLADDSGKILGLSMAVDPKEATPPAAAPVGVKAQVTARGVELDWEFGPPTPGLPEVFFRPRRDDGHGVQTLGNGPIFPGNETARREQRQPRFVDSAAPVEQEVTYTIVALDVFGRESLPSAPLKLFVPDLAAGFPPDSVETQQGGGQVIVTWSAPKSPRCAGYLVERSAFEPGPYVQLNEKPLPAGSARYVDTTGKTGARYYYRVYALDPRKKSGPPSRPAAALFIAAAAPAAPSGLEATMGMDRVTLRWQVVPAAAGYRVERAPEGSDSWVPAADAPVPEARFDDGFPQGMEGALRYRVVALGADGQAGPPSAALAVPLPSNRPPGVPKVTGFDGRGGVVRIEFVPGGDPEKAQGFLVLRSATASGEARVVTPSPLSGTTRSYTDEQVVPGEEYWYSLVAIDRAQNRSEVSSPVVVRVGDPPLLAPPAPQGQFFASPFPRVVVSFAPARGAVGAVVERQEAGGWVRVAGPLPPGATQGVDARPPRGGSAIYRVYYRALNGAEGLPSPPVTVPLP